MMRGICQSERSTTHQDCAWQWYISAVPPARQRTDCMMTSCRSEWSASSRAVTEHGTCRELHNPWRIEFSYVRHLSHTDYPDAPRRTLLHILDVQEGIHIQCWRSSVDANVLVRSHARPQSELITDLPAPHVHSPFALTYTAHSLAGASVFSPRLKHLYVPLCFLCVPLLTVICSLLF